MLMGLGRVCGRTRPFILEKAFILEKEKRTAGTWSRVLLIGIWTADTEGRKNTRSGAGGAGRCCCLWCGTDRAENRDHAWSAEAVCKACTGSDLCERSVWAPSANPGYLVFVSIRRVWRTVLLPGVVRERRTSEESYHIDVLIVGWVMTWSQVRSKRSTICERPLVHLLISLVSLASLA